MQCGKPHCIFCFEEKGGKSAVDFGGVFAMI